MGEHGREDGPTGSVVPTCLVLDGGVPASQIPASLRAHSPYPEEFGEVVTAPNQNLRSDRTQLGTATGGEVTHRVEYPGIPARYALTCHDPRKRQTGEGNPASAHLRN